MIGEATEAIRICRDLHKERKLIPFIGAGFSLRFKLPSWNELVDIIAEELDWDPTVFGDSGNPLQLAEYYVAVKGSVGPLRSKMDKAFNPPDAEVAKSPAHTALTKLQPPLIYTTNFDEIIERAFELHGVPFKRVANIDDIHDTQLGVTQIVKFHGTFDDDSSLVLTESNYFDRLDFESALDIKLRGDMLGRCLLFVGYSFSDLNMRLMIYKLNKLRQLHKTSQSFPTAIMTAFAPNDVERELLSRRNVMVAELDPIDRTSSMDGFLESLL